jgi:hypothetical protein
VFYAQGAGKFTSNVSVGKSEKPVRNQKMSRQKVGMGHVPTCAEYLSLLLLMVICWHAIGKMFSEERMNSDAVAERGAP